MCCVWRVAWVTGWGPRVWGVGAAHRPKPVWTTSATRPGHGDSRFEASAWWLGSRFSAQGVASKWVWPKWW